MTLNIKLGAELKRYRLKAGLTGAAMAKSLGKSAAYTYHLENDLLTPAKTTIHTYLKKTHTPESVFAKFLRAEVRRQIAKLT